MSAVELLGLDLGMKRSGIARASSAARLAQPLTTVPTDELLSVLKKLTSDNEVEQIIVGLPRNLDGNDTEQTKWVRQWLSKAETELPGIDFRLQDEALTTDMAAQRGGKNVTDLDAEAAAIILQDYIDANEVIHEKA